MLYTHLFVQIYWTDLFVSFFSSRRRHTRCALVTGVQTWALPISAPAGAEPVSRQVEPERLQLGDRLAPLGALLGLQHEAAALVEVDEVGAVGPLDAAHLHPPLEDVGVALLGLDRRLGLRRADEVAKLGQEELVVRALAAAGRGPALDKGFDGRLGIGHAVTRRVWRSLEGSGPVAGRRRRGRGRRSTVAFNYTWPFPDLVKIRPGRPLEQIRVGFMLSDLAGC